MPRCRICNRKIQGESGIGPVCARRMGLTPERRKRRKKESTRKYKNNSGSSDDSYIYSIR
jgi:hypothetical protein